MARFFDGFVNGTGGFSTAPAVSQRHRRAGRRPASKLGGREQGSGLDENDAGDEGAGFTRPRGEKIDNEEQEPEEKDFDQLTRCIRAAGDE